MAPSILRSRRTLAGVALAAVAGGLVAAAPANASSGYPIIFSPYITFVQWHSASETLDGRAVFYADKTEVPVLVHAEPGDLTLTDEDGNVLCTVSKERFPHDTCDIVGMVAGEHTVKGTIRNNHGVQQIPAVTVVSFAEEAPDTAVPAPGEVDPGFAVHKPVVAQPNPGETDPGFTIPIVAQPNPGETDPGFTAPQPVVAQPNPGETDPGFTAGKPITLADTHLDDDGSLTVAEFIGKPGQQWRASFPTADGPIQTTGTIDESGRFALKLRIKAGKNSPGTIVITNPRTGTPERYNFTIASASSGTA
ncbi:hypothetical protein [Curtobacterium sp. ISL-83]|uniref:hypothetical protein n=1 Tax=Curtobacterium sp. ISL-83 TaxID=2819145 RepID=UPI001BE89813|nr:hypothetical protein [Curtobacterium sp. ISL-83]MBT2504043.1 hypothetical protein [Curtobacterium sp. ISL-83]